MTKSLVTSLACGHLIRQAARLLKDYHFVLSFGPALFYVNMTFFGLAALYILVCLLLWTSAVRRSPNHSMDQEIEMTEKSTTKIEPAPKKPETEDGEAAWEIDPPLPNYQQMSRFLVSSGILSQLIFFGTLLVDQFIAPHTTRSLL